MRKPNHRNRYYSRICQGTTRYNLTYVQNTTNSAGSLSQMLGILQTLLRTPTRNVGNGFICQFLHLPQIAWMHANALLLFVCNIRIYVQVYCVIYWVKRYMFPTTCWIPWIYQNIEARCQVNIYQVNITMGLSEWIYLKIK